MAVILILPARIAWLVKTLANAIVAKSGFEKFHLVSLISAPSLLVILGLNPTVIERRVTEREATQAARFDLPVHVRRVTENNCKKTLTK